MKVFMNAIAIEIVKFHDDKVPTENQGNLHSFMNYGYNIASIH